MQSVIISNNILLPLLCVCVCARMCFSFLTFSSSTEVLRFVSRKALLQTLRADDLSLLESFPKRWNSLERPSAEENITGEITD